MSREDARDIRFREMLREQSPKDERFQCVNPFPIHAIGLPSFLEGDLGNIPLELHGRCRQCEPCLKHRRRLWTARAVDEIAASNRTWFGTLTVAPAERFRLRVLAERKHLRASGENLHDLTSDEQFRLVAAELNREATLWLKRLRKTQPALRYLLVTEAHKSGDPHLHLLLHEGAQPVAKRSLEACWKLGYSNWRLVDQDRGAAVYVCKYLAKSALTRVRASIRYGRTQLLRSSTERLEAVTRSMAGVAPLSGDNQPVKRSRAKL